LNPLVILVSGLNLYAQTLAPDPAQACWVQRTEILAPYIGYLTTQIRNSSKDNSSQGYQDPSVAIQAQKKLVLEVDLFDRQFQHILYHNPDIKICHQMIEQFANQLFEETKITLDIGK
jgi:hypothetical protein